jgi:hypothetical protein
MLRVANHVHDRDLRCVELFDHLLRRDTNGTHEEAGLLLDDDIDELRQLACETIAGQVIKLVEK